MFQDMQIPVVPIGEEDTWVDEIKTLTTGATSVTFNIGSNNGYGYKLFLEKASGATTLPKQVGPMDFSTAGQVTINLTTVTTEQNNTKARLRCFK